MAKKTLDVNPWLQIWLHPRETIRKLVRFNPKYRFLVLSFLYGLPMLLHTAQNFSLGEDFTGIGIAVFAVILAIFIGMLGITIASGLLYWTGQWIGGEAKYQEVRCAVSWSNVPNILSILSWILLIFVFDGALFLENFQASVTQGPEMMIVTGALVVQTIVSIWSFVILVKGLGEVQGFSAWKGVLNVLIPFFMVGLFIWLLTWMYWIFDGMPAAS